MGLFKKKNKQEDKGIAGTKIHVIINRLMSDVTPVVVAEFDAVQVKDDDFNFQIINEELNFKEDLSMEKNRALDYITYKLELKKKSQEESLKLIDDKINELDKKIKSIENGKIGEIKVNRIDLENELKHYKVLKYHISTKGNGSYERINKNGDREIQFCTIEGVLYPYFWRSNTDNNERLLLFPDMVTKRKFYREGNERVEERFIKSQAGFFSGLKGILATIAIVVLIISGVILNIRGGEKISEAEEIIMQRTAKYQAMAQENAVGCSYYFTELLKNGMINQSLEIPTDPEEKEERRGIGDIVDISQRALGTT